MTGIICIKEERDEQKLHQIISLCERFIKMLPDKNKWLNLYENHPYILLTLEKLIYLINYRFLQELNSISQDTWIKEHLEKMFPYAMDRFLRDFFDTPKSKYGICEEGYDLLYFQESSLYGISISERNHWFSFYEEHVAALANYCVEEKEILESQIEDPFIVMQTYFPKIVNVDPDFCTFAYEYVTEMQGALQSDYDHCFLIHSCHKLFDFQKWIRRDNRRKTYPECRKLLEYIEEYKNPMLDITQNSPFYYIETMENTYMCYAYRTDEFSGNTTDGKYFFPSHFFVMVIIECLLHIIAIKYY